MIATIANRVIENTSKSIEKHKHNEKITVDNLKKEFSAAKNDFSLTILKLKQFAENDKEQISNLQGDYLKLIAELTMANSKLDFLEKKIEEKFEEVEDNVSANKLTNEQLEMAIRKVIHLVIKNKKNLKNVVIKTISKDNNIKKVDERNSLITNLELLNDNIIILNNKVNKMAEDVDVLYTNYLKRQRIKKLLRLLFNKTKPLLKTIYKYTIKSVIMRCVVYLSVITAGSPEVVRLLNYLSKLFEG